MSVFNPCETQFGSDVGRRERGEERDCLGIDTEEDISKLKAFDIFKENCSKNCHKETKLEKTNKQTKNATLEAHYLAQILIFRLDEEGRFPV